MPRIRTIKPEFFTHWELYSLEKETGLPCRVAFSGLWTLADREGRFRWIPQQLKLGCLPYDEIDFSRVLDALWTRGFIVKYRVEGADFGHIPGWSSHQVINNRESQSVLPEPSPDNTLTRESRVDDECLSREVHAQVEGKGRKGKEGNKEPRVPRLSNQVLDQEFAKFWDAYDKKVGRAECEMIWRKLNLEEETIAKILEAAAAYKAVTPDKQFRKDPSTWLNKRCWNDEIVPRVPEQKPVFQTISHQAATKLAAGRTIFGDERSLANDQRVIDISPPQIAG